MFDSIFFVLLLVKILLELYVANSKPTINTYIVINEYKSPYWPTKSTSYSRPKKSKKVNLPISVVDLQNILEMKVDALFFK